ncbi:polysaccharide deacetylase family protein [Xanthomarina spongicola]|uniref:Peptidoglycan/xylan/chitin deacetylase (PgdA/CDA1 family) n=1 Tax=Xanthomarina spongicola TaxID=570520 RepID=A0A316DRG9_9FLAO|nr:polysaccharide deacetylase family protein [Xanthomarina spongicola]PWK20877.1 peptidoglycan/xylan/chitin deacetylase (PgdA/CDA1 family) [Xanthomarina spongicola]
MEFIPAKLPFFVRKLFPKYIWNMSSDEKVIYLTFDDGPTPKITNWTLDILNQFNAKATFFCTGDNVQKHPEIFQDIIKKGHVIGNHTFNHPNGLKSPTKAYLENVKQAQEIINFQLLKSELNNQQTKTCNLFRPPYGQITKKQGRELINLGYNIIMWHVLAIDWSARTNKKSSLKNVINNAGNGSIVVFHDSEKASENMMYALPKTLEYFSNKGYTFKSLTI